MKILHVNKFFDLHGGAEVYMHGLMRKQAQLGHEVHVFSTRSIKNVSSEDEKFFVTRYHLDRSDGPITDLKKAGNFIWNLEAENAFGQLVAEVKPDVVHIHNIYHHLSASVLAVIRKQKIPCVQTLHDYKLACPNYRMFTEGSPCERCRDGNYLQAVKHHCLSASLIPNVLAALEMGITKSRQSYERTVQIFLCPSNFMKEKMEDWGEPAKKMRYAPNPTELPEKTAEMGGGYLIYAGRLSQEKGLRSFIEAAAKVPELPIKIAGRGPEDEDLRSFVESVGASHIEFLGFVAPDDLLQLRHRAEALILPTLSYENASGSVLEAMASGLPCIVTRIGGNPELVEDGVNGFLVQPGDSEDWLRALRRFQALPEEARKEMGKKGRAKIEGKRTWNAHVETVLSCYREAGVKD